MGPDPTGQWGHSSDQAAGQLDSLIHINTLQNCSFSTIEHFFLFFSVFFSFFFSFCYFFSLISLDWCRWAQLDGAKRLGNTHSEVEL